MTKFFIDQHGCAKNQTDGELIAGYLIKDGFELTLNADDADFIIINSCGFIESAKKESIDAIYSVKANYPNAKIILAGCLAERYANMFLDSMPELDGVFGNGNLSKIAEFMHSVQNKRTVQTYAQSGVCSGERPVLFNFPGTAFVKITEGCSNHCSFCAIPLIRGELRSRPIQEIISEIKQLVSDGVYEINLIGQDLAAFESDVNVLVDKNVVVEPVETTNKSGLSVLLSEISKISGDFIVRPLYIHPDHFNLDILPVMANDKRFVPYFDIPFQSGDKNIIHAMNRTGSGKKYEQLVKDIRTALPQAVLRTTFLTGFPGETDDAAQNTYDFLNAIQPDWSGCFPYSKEENTPAFSLKGKVSSKVAKKRAERLESLQSEITNNKMQKYIGQEINVLVEEIIQLNPETAEDVTEGLAIGRGWFQAPEVDGCIVIRYDADIPSDVDAVKPGNVISVKILATTGVDLDGRFIKSVKNLEKKGRKYIY